MQEYFKVVIYLFLFSIIILIMLKLKEIYSRVDICDDMLSECVTYKSLKIILDSSTLSDIENYRNTIDSS